MYISLSYELEPRANCMAKRSDPTAFVAKKKTGPNRGFLSGIITSASRLVSGGFAAGMELPNTSSEAVIMSTNASP